MLVLKNSFAILETKTICLSGSFDFMESIKQLKQSSSSSKGTIDEWHTYDGLCESEGLTEANAKAPAGARARARADAIKAHTIKHTQQQQQQQPQQQLPQDRLQGHSDQEPRWGAVDEHVVERWFGKHKYTQTQNPKPKTSFGNIQNI